MTEISQTIFNKYQIRKTKQQKTSFIDFIRSKFPDAKIEQGGFGNNRNIVIGDVDSAEVVLTAHYDTCAVLPFPNFLTPKNMFIYILYSLLICVVMFAVCFAACMLASIFTDSFAVLYLVGYSVFLLLFAAMLAGKPNKHTANDNTSGVITLCTLLETMSEEQRRKAAFVFFDNEENMLLGSRFFANSHKEVMKQKLVLNFDCVSDGDNIMLVLNRKAKDSYAEAVRSAFKPAEGKNVLVETTSTAFYPSDQGNFPVGIGVAAFNRKKVIGYYMDKIHTAKDTVFDEKNIEFICECTKRFVDII